MSRLLFLLVMSVVMSVSAGAESITVFFPSVKDKITKRGIVVIYTLYKSGPDSVFNLVKSSPRGNIVLPEWSPEETYKLIVTGGETVERREEYAIYRDVIPTGEYVDETVVFKIPASAGKEYRLPQIELSRFSKIDLKEVSVTASKVMFYHKGDTLVYNADAFVLPDGSMLDALLNQMPGVELRSGGEIYCNGKKIDNLLLNGRDLFNGNRELMLENLGAYTVKDIAVYDKQGRMSELMKVKTGTTAHVMDVRLKREYAQGYLANIEGGYGTHDRYLARLFGMWMSENVSVSAYAGANNLSDKRKPGQYDNAWSVSNIGNGVSTQRHGGLMYDARGFADRWQMRGSVDVAHSNPVVDTKSVSQRYSTTGNSYNYSWRQSDVRDLDVSTSHELFFKMGSRIHLEVKPRFSYKSGKESRANVSAAFREDVKDISLQQVLGIFSTDGTLESSLMNRLIDTDTIRSHKISPSLDAKMDIRLHDGSKPTALTISGNTFYERGREKRFNRYSLNYGDQQPVESSTLRYYKQFPDFNVKCNVGVAFTKILGPNEELPLSFTSSYDRKRRTRYLYQNEASGDAVVDSGSEFADLYDWVPDMSYHYIQTDKKQTIGFAPRYLRGFSLPYNMHVSMEADISVDFYSRNLMYVRGAVPSGIKRDAVLPQARMSVMFGKAKNNVRQYTLNLEYKAIPVDMLMLVDMPSVDPLNLQLGNPDLKNQSIYRVSLNSFKHVRESRLQESIGVSFSLMRNSIDHTCVIDPVSGRMTSQPFNVNGNKSASANYNLVSSFGKIKQFNVSTDTRIYYNHTVGHFGDDVDNCSAEEKLKLGWQNGKHKVAAFTNVKFDRFLHSSDKYDDFSAWTCKYGAEAVLNLPANWSFSTDMALYTRRGFADPRANTTDLVWNMRVSKSIMKGALLFIVDGFDILQQLKSVTYSVNPQARTEIRHNTIPSYVLFHVQYRINKRPKAKISH